MRGLVFNIQRYSIHDGGGIRTLVFLKGCPLFCPWCSNPESQGKVEPTTWIRNNKKEIVGKWMTVEEVMEEINKDELFYRVSDGGVTISGGEPLVQDQFVSELLKELNRLGIHTAIETTGCIQKEKLKNVAPYTDLFLFDLKIWDAQLLKNITGGNLNIIRENLLWLVEQKKEIIPRMPLIPDYTATKSNIGSIIGLLQEFHFHKIHLLPFHQYGSKKYEYLKREYKLSNALVFRKEEIDNITRLFQEHEIECVVSGLE